MSTVEQQIVTRLTTAAGFTSLAGTRCYEQFAPQAAARPFVTFERISTDPTNTLTGPTDDDDQACRFQVTAWADSSAAAAALMTVVNGLLAGWRNTALTPRIDSCHRVDQRDVPAQQVPGRDGFIFGQQADYLIWTSLNP
jgi:hypothetical protein